MGVALLTEEEARAAVASYITSKAWWIIPWVSDRASGLSQEIERKYYRGRASADFQMMLCPPTSGVFAVAFAHKRRLSARQLAKVVKQRSSVEDQAELERVLAEQDILIALDSEADEHTQDAWVRAQVWHDWVTR